MRAPSPHDLATDLFLEALGRPPAERERWLASACPDPDLRREVQAMLDHHDEADAGFLDTPVLTRRSDARQGQIIGPWRLGALLGEGGMGAVYHAERDDATFEQQAALKLVRPGVGPGFLARFVRERAVLAGLDHPGIARLLDGGVTPDGAPYLAMERVDGEPITAYAEHHCLGVEDRLRLVLQVCEAVAHAHRNLVVHRDLKPAHILVTGGIRDERGMGRDEGSSVSPPLNPSISHRSPHVKLLDFGIATLLDADGELLTQTGASPMTPAYAAPEQLLRQPVTTATDVYALGVVLYELLAGRRPYRLGDLTAAQVEHVVCEADPPRPSEANAELRGDLDAIVLKAMAKEPARRYASAAALADDLRRYLDGLPVEARAPTVRYRTGRFVRRHRGGVLAAAAALLVFGLYTVRLGVERNRAQEAALVAEREAERSDAVSSFLEQILRAPNARWYNRAEAKGPETPVRAVLDEAALRLDREFADQPDLRADLHHVLGDTYLALGLGSEAALHHGRVLALRESLYTPPHPKLAEALYYAYPFAESPAEQGRLLRQAVEMQRARNEGNNFPFMAQDLADRHLWAGRPAEAAPLLREAFAFVSDRFVPGHDGEPYRLPVQAGLASSLVRAHLDLDDLASATRWLEAADSLVARLPPEAASRAAWQVLACTRGRLLRMQSRYPEAERALLGCAGEGPPRGLASPFPGLPASAPPRVRHELVALYDAWSRPEVAAPHREAAARFVAARDSVRRVYADDL
ncbi:MAG: serine/threonine-protein kinase [Bacteroidota bacterium]